MPASFSPLSACSKLQSHLFAGNATSQMIAFPGIVRQTRRWVCGFRRTLRPLAKRSRSSNTGFDLGVLGADSHLPICNWTGDSGDTQTVSNQSLRASSSQRTMSSSSAPVPTSPEPVAGHVDGQRRDGTLPCLQCRAIRKSWPSDFRSRCQEAVKQCETLQQENEEILAEHVLASVQQLAWQSLVPEGMLWGFRLSLG